MIQFLITVLIIPTLSWAEEKNAPKPVIESVVIQDLMLHADEVVNIKSSNSSGCKKPCTVKNYTNHQFTEISKQIEKIKKTPKKSYTKTFGSSVDEKTNPESRFSGGCAPQMEIKMWPEAYESKKLKLPAEDKLILCQFNLSFGFGELVWSEQLIYLKDKSTNEVIPGTFVAVGTP